MTFLLDKKYFALNKLYVLTSFMKLPSWQNSSPLHLFLKNLTSKLHIQFQAQGNKSNHHTDKIHKNSSNWTLVYIYIFVPTEQIYLLYILIICPLYMNSFKKKEKKEVHTFNAVMLTHSAKTRRNRNTGVTV